MKRMIPLGLALLLCGVAFAQAPLPAGVTPVVGEIKMLYHPTFESRCSTKMYEKRPGSFFGSHMDKTGIFAVMEDANGAVKLWMQIEEIRMIGTVNEDRTDLAFAEVDIQLGTNLSVAEREELFSARHLLRDVMKNAFGKGIGVRLSQGAVVPTDFCGLLAGARAKSQSGTFTVKGVATIRGRESVVIGGEQKSSCLFGDQQFDYQTRGWFAVDRQSGLPIDQSTASIGIENIATTNDRVCNISGTLAKTTLVTIPGAFSAPSVKSAEQRLTELKSLMDKGLITQEQFEQKRVEILKAL